MNRIHVSKSDLFSMALIGIFVLLVLIPVCPANMPIAGRDSGVFLYSGWRMLGGDVPYKEFWDHKPPIIFFINAFGLLISQNSRWGVWFLELFSLYLAGILSFKLFKKAFNNLAAIVAVIIWLFSLGFMLDGGNYTTEYALPLQFVCFWLAFESELFGNYGWRGFCIGVLSGLLFFTKQTTTGIIIAILIYVVVSRAPLGKWREMLNIMVLILGGFVLVSTVVFLLFFFWGALEDFWNAAFLFNFAYSAAPNLNDHVQALYRSWLVISSTNLAWLGIMGWSIVLAAFLIANNSIKPFIKPLLAIGLIDLPIELGLVFLEGRLINHHFMTLLPVFALFAAFFLSTFFEGIASWLGNIYRRIVDRVIIVTLIITLPFVYIKQIQDYKELVIGYRTDEYKALEVVAYIIKNTSSQDSILALNSDAFINFATRRVAPDRFVYQSPLDMKGYTSEKMVKGFFTDVIERHPVYIVEKDGNWLRPEDFLIKSKDISALIDQIHSSYTLETEIGLWKIYRYSGG
jgi:hypothetical protein